MSEQRLQDIYTTEELEQLCDRLMVYVERPSIFDLEQFYRVHSSHINCIDILLDGTIPLEELPLMFHIKTLYFKEIIHWRFSIGR